MFCRNCGEPLKDGASFCTECDDYPIACLTKEGWTAYLIGKQDDYSDDCYVLDCGDGALLGMTPFAN